MTKLSFVVSTYSRESSTKKLVESIRLNIPSENYEIIFVSSDDPECEKSKWLKSQKDIKTIFSDKRINKRLRSLYYYENLGIKSSSYEWIFVTNDDTSVTKDFYNNFIKVSDLYDIILVNGHIGDIRLGARIPVIGSIVDPHGVKKDLYLYDFTLIKKSVYEEIGYLDEKLDWFGKGVDLALMCETKNKFNILHNSDICVNHDISIENRNPPGCINDFSYIDYKWSEICKNSGWSYTWPW